MSLIKINLKGINLKYVHIGFWKQQLWSESVNTFIGAE